MSCRTISQNEDGYITIASSRIIAVNNVESYKYDEQNFNAWHLTIRSFEEVAENRYFIIDTHFHDAFAHWFFESATYLPAFLELRRQIPNLKLHLKSHRKYKTVICKYFNITEADIEYGLRGPNTCYFPAPITAFNEQVCTDEFVRLVSNLRAYFPNAPQLRCRGRLFLPRQKTDNFTPHNKDRIQNFEDIEKHMANDVIYTDTFQSFADQVSAVQSTDILVIPDASAFLVNGFFMNAAKIVVLGNVTDYQATHFPKYGHVNHLIVSTNHVHKVPYECVGGSFESARFQFEHIAAHLK